MVSGKKKEAEKRVRESHGIGMATNKKKINTLGPLSLFLRGLHRIKAVLSSQHNLKSDLIPSIQFLSFFYYYFLFSL